MRILVTDPISEEGLELLRSRAEVVARRVSPAELLTLVCDFDALVVRSETKVTRAVVEAGTRLRVIGRAGAGVDNIDVDAATRRGVLVVNAPSGNNVAVAEHAFGLMLALARRIPAADASVRRGEWTRGRFQGVELRGKTLGIVGLGKIGTELARRAQALEMRVLAYDPFLSAEHARRLGVELTSFEHVLAEADFLSIHVPLTPQTRNLVGAAELAQMKPGAFLINCARGGIVDEAALAEALQAGRLAGAGLDVFEREPPPADSPLLRLPNVVLTPHLGGSTAEAQQTVARQVAEQVLIALDGRTPPHAVNAPALPAEQAATLAPFLTLARLLGSLATQLAEGQFLAVEVGLHGELAATDGAALTAAAIQGLLQPISEEPVNLVNARLVAAERGLDVQERRTTQAEGYTSLVTITVSTEAGARRVAGTVMRGESHVVGIDGYSLDLAPTSGYLLVTSHLDQPGMIGQVGTILGEADINVSAMQVGRRTPRGQAIMVLSLDEPVPADVLARIRAIPNMSTARLIRLAPVHSGAP